MYPLYGEQRFYRVSNDPDFNPQEPIKKAFLRTYKNKTSGEASIVCGHYTNSTQPGKHYTWLRHPLHRDISHFNYDSNYGHALDKDFATHLSMMAGNFLTLWIYSKYLGLTDALPMQTKYEKARSALKNNFEKVFDSDDFENSWNYIAKELDIPLIYNASYSPNYNPIEGVIGLAKNYIKQMRWHNLTLNKKMDDKELINLAMKRVEKIKI